MTDKQKAAFLKSEGWKRRKDSEFGDMIWVDPLGRWERMNTASAFQAAHRRKSQRESRRLKAAGCYWSPFANDTWDSGWFDAGHNWIGKTKAEALSTLEAP